MAGPGEADGRAVVEGEGVALGGLHALAVRFAWPGHLMDLVGAAAPFFGTLFTAVVLGVVETAVETARGQILPKADALRAYEQVEWTQAEAEAWTIAQVYEGMLRAIESGQPAFGAALRGKMIAAQLAESVMLRLGRVLGGGTFSRRSPFGHWFEDVRALGFLRPPWGLASDAVFLDTLAPTVG